MLLFKTERSFAFKKIRNSPPRFQAKGDKWEFTIWRSKSTNQLFFSAKRLNNEGKWEFYQLEGGKSIFQKKIDGVDLIVHIYNPPTKKKWLGIDLNTIDPYNYYYCWKAMIDCIRATFNILPALEGINYRKGEMHVIS